MWSGRLCIASVYVTVAVATTSFRTNKKSQARDQLQLDVKATTPKDATPWAYGWGTAAEWRQIRDSSFDGMYACTQSGWTGHDFFLLGQKGMVNNGRCAYTTGVGYRGGGVECYDDGDDAKVRCFKWDIPNACARQMLAEVEQYFDSVSLASLVMPFVGASSARSMV